MVKPWRPRTGEAAVYVSRAKALRRLGVSLADFRKLCILKGIFPRVPKRKLAGRDKVYYHAKDITHLAHEPLLDTFRADKVAKRRVRKAVCKQEYHRARAIAERSEANRPGLAHIIKERYPTIEYALGDLDDALSCIALFANLPVANEDSITGEVVTECRNLLDQWMALIAEEGCLDKVFATIKGYYYQATVKGVKIVWLSPHEFPVSKDHDVDLRVMATFLQLYTELVRFVLFKLYKTCGYQYPPAQKVTHKARLAAGRWLNIALEHVEGAEAAQSESLTEKASPLHTESADGQKRRKLFEKQVFYVSRDAPVWQMVFCLKACGAKLIGFDEPVIDDKFHKPMSALEMKDSRVTHHIVDRPENALASLQIDNIKDRILVVPQWVFDSINIAELIPTVPYRPGATPPPHLSPFVDDVAEGYVPEQRKVLEEWAGKSLRETLASVGAGTEDAAARDILQSHTSGDTTHEEISAIVEATAVPSTVSEPAPQPKESKLDEKLVEIRKARKQKE